METAVTIRPLTIGDSSGMVDVLSSTGLYTHIGGRPPTQDELTALYTRQTKGYSSDGSQEWLNWIVLADGSMPVGYVQASRPVAGATAEIAWVIGVAWQGRGHATAAVRLMVEGLAGREMDEITACIHPANEASMGVARRIGMRQTGEVIGGET